MDQNELNYFVQVLQKRIGEYFQQSLVYEARFQQQNDIITKQNERIEELIKEVEDYKSQIENIDEIAKKQAARAATVKSRKKTTSPGDGGTFW